MTQENVLCFCSEDDVLNKEKDILDLVDNGDINTAIIDASRDIVDELLINEIVLDEDLLTNNIRQLRLPCVYKTLANIFTANIKDEDSPYDKKADLYKGDYDSFMSQIRSLDLDINKDDSISEDEKNQPVIKMFTRIS